jgi:hypothetical protein
MFNVYKIGAGPDWDGAIYNRLVQDYLRAGLSFAGLSGEIKDGDNQLKVSYLHRPFFIALSGYLQKWTGYPLVQIYPAMNLVFLSLAAYYVYLICLSLYILPTLPSLLAACWLLVSPPVLVIHQIVASPEPLVLCFTAGTYYYFGLKRYLLAYLTLALAILSKPSTLVLSVYFFIQLLYALRQTRSPQVFRNIILLAVASIFAMLLPHLLLNHGKAILDLNAIAVEIVAPNWGHLFMNLLFNFGVLWIPFAAYLPFTNSAYRTGIIYLVLVSAALAVIGATDWWRVWFGILFVFVLPGAAGGLVRLCRESQSVTLVAMVALSVIVLQAYPTVQMNQVTSPDKIMYMWAAAIMLVAAVAAGSHNPAPKEPSLEVTAPPAPKRK